MSGSGGRPGGGFLDRRRAARLMADLGLSALVLARPESILYASGAFAGVASLWRQAGAAFVIVPADPDAPLAAVVGDLQAEGFAKVSGIADTRSHPIWVEGTALASGDVTTDIAAAIVQADQARGRPDGFARPATFDAQAALGHLRDVLMVRGLLAGSAPRIGLELGFVPVADMPLFERTFPNVAWIDASPLVARLRMIKHPAEIERLRLAAELSTAGMQRLFFELAEGHDAASLTAIWRAGVDAEAKRRALSETLSTWAYISVGPDGFAPGGPARRGDIVKVDVGCVVGGYSSDGARTAVLGRPAPAQRQVFDALHRAFDAGLALLRPGRQLREAHAAATASMHASGFTTYTRGHFGHSLGASIWSEEWPFISADSEVVVEPGMILAFETPYYIGGLGGFIIEDQFLITEAGPQAMAPMPRELIEIAV